MKCPKCGPTNVAREAKDERVRRLVLKIFYKVLSLERKIANGWAKKEEAAHLLPWITQTMIDESRYQANLNQFDGQASGDE